MEESTRNEARNGKPSISQSHHAAKKCLLPRHRGAIGNNSVQATSAFKRTGPWCQPARNNHSTPRTVEEQPLHLIMALLHPLCGDVPGIGPAASPASGAESDKITLGSTAGALPPRKVVSNTGRLLKEHKHAGPMSQQTVGGTRTTRQLCSTKFR
jgi:hypothetical protein